MNRRHLLAALLAAIVTPSSGARAQTLAAPDPRASVPAPAAAIQTPSEFHGFDIGQRYIITRAVIDYYRMLGEQSPRVDFDTYGASVQGRELPIVFIGSERNVARRTEIQERMRALLEVTAPHAAGALERLITDLPAIVWIFIVDTDEEAGVNVLQEVAHDLAGREDEEARSIRDNVLVIMTPLTNPDSHARYVTWHMIYDVPGASTDPLAVENDPHWAMNTDGNAHGIDVNRDFSAFVTPEMQALARAAMAWRPQFFLDIHSGPNVIFLPPFPRPFHPLWPAEAPKWWDVFARRASENFGAKGWSFNSREGYEGVTSPTFGLSWGMLGPGMSGMLFETFGGRPGKTIAFVRDDGTLATMRMAMDRHAEGIWSLLQTVRDHRAEILKDAHKVVTDAVAGARANSVRSVLLPAAGPGVDPDKTERLVERLVLQGVQVRRTDQPVTVAARSVFDLAAPGARTFAPGTFVVDLVQPNARLARALLDPTIDYSNPQVEVPYRTKMPYYDSSWGNLALPFGVPSFVTGEVVVGGGSLVQDGQVGRRSLRGAVRPLERAAPAYAWILPAGLESSYRAALALAQEGYKVRVFNTAFRIGETTWPKGTFALIRLRNPESLPERLEQVAQEQGATLVAIAGPFTDAGATFGDEGRLQALPEPKVAVLADWPVAQDHIFGGIRSTLEDDFGFGFTPIMMETLNRGSLDKYTVVVLPHAGMDVRGGPGFDAGYRGMLHLENLRRYAQAGGTVIAVKGAGELLAKDSVLGRDVDFEGYAEFTNGGILRANWVVGEQPEGELVAWRPGLSTLGMPLLGAGYENVDLAVPGLYPVLLSLDPEGAAAVVARFTADPDRILLDGYMLDEDRAKLAGRPFLVVQPVGRGRVLYLAEDITFRGYWYGLNQLFLNALLFGPLL